MKILEILNSEVENAEKLKTILSLVDKTREIYGNTSAELPKEKVNTTDGWVDIGWLTLDEKVAIAASQIKASAQQASALSSDDEGVVFDREFERLIATNRILCNLEDKSNSSY